MRYPCPLLRKLNSRPGSNTELPSQNEPKKTYKILLTGSVAKGPLQTQTLIKNWKTTTFSRFWNEETRILGSTWLYAFTARFAGVVEAGIEKIQPQISRINHIITFQTRSDTRTWDDENLLPVTKVFTEKKVASVDDIFLQHFRDFTPLDPYAELRRRVTFLSHPDVVSFTGISNPSWPTIAHSIEAKRFPSIRLHLIRPHFQGSEPFDDLHLSWTSHPTRSTDSLQDQNETAPTTKIKVRPRFLGGALGTTGGSAGHSSPCFLVAYRDSLSIDREKTEEPRPTTPHHQLARFFLLGFGFVVFYCSTHGPSRVPCCHLEATPKRLPRPLFPKAAIISAIFNNELVFTSEDRACPYVCEVRLTREIRTVRARTGNFVLKKRFVMGQSKKKTRCPFASSP